MILPTKRASVLRTDPNKYGHSCGLQNCSMFRKGPQEGHKPALEGATVLRPVALGMQLQSRRLAIMLAGACSQHFWTSYC